MTFSRNQNLKLCLLQLGGVYKLPLDLIYYIYEQKRSSENEDINIVRLYHQNLIFRLSLDTCGNRIFNPGNPKNEQKLYKWCRDFKEVENNLHKEMYLDRSPITKDKCPLLWAIKKSNLRKQGDLWYYSECEYQDYRQKLITEINILGTENYLFDDDSRNASLKECNIRKKILYLNKSPWGEIESDYLNFCDQTIDEQDLTYSLLIDNTGDSYYF